MRTSGAAAVLDALFLPFASGAIEAPSSGRIALFLRARAGAWVHAWPRAAFVCAQTFKPFADELERAGLQVAEPAALAASAQAFPLVLVLPPRQRDEARALLAHAVRHATPGGVVLACQPNNEGARSGQSDLERLAGPVQGQSRHKCRVFRTAPLGDQVDTATRDAWMALDAAQPVAEGRYVSRPGLFAWDRIDAASALLAACLPDTLAGRAADLGAGFGYLACELVRRCPGIVAIDLYEAEQRALGPARTNLDRAMGEQARVVGTGFFWHDVRRGLPRRYDVIVSNPPFHQGRADQPELGRAFIAAAAGALEADGRFWMVANRHLPYEAVLDERFIDVRTVAQRDGYKVITATGVRQ